MTIFTFLFVIYLVIPYHIKEGSSHKHKRTIAQDFIKKSLSQSIEFNLSLNRYSYSTDHSGPLTLRVTHNSGPQEVSSVSNNQKTKRSSIQDRHSSKTVTNLRNNLLQLEKQLFQAQKELNAQNNSSFRKRSTVEGRPFQFERMVGLFICNQVQEDESTIYLDSQRLLGMKTRQTLTPSYQDNKYYTGNLIKALQGNVDRSISSHLTAMISSMKRAMILRMPSQIDIQNRRVTLNCPPQPGRKTLLLQIQKILLFINKSKEHQDDLEIGLVNSTFFVTLRPYLFSFLKKIMQYFEIVVFTTLQLSTAKLILQDIDPEGKIFSECLGKEHCLSLKGEALFKDIRIINRGNRQVVLIDASPDAGQLNPQNWLPIFPYTTGEDRQLMQLQKNLLKEIANARDVREMLREKSKLNRYWHYESCQSLVRELYMD